VMKDALVSIIIPCYNYGNFLPEAVQSVLSQTFQSLECLIIDDGSKDNTQEISGELMKADPRVKYFSKENGGLSSARNYGITMASGQFVCFLDADDLLHEKKLEEQLKCFEANPGSDIVYGNAMFFEKNNRGVLYRNKAKDNSKKMITVDGDGKKMLSALVDENITVVSSPLIRKKVFEQAGNFDITYKSYEDWHFWIKCALADQHFKYCAAPEVCTYIRFGHESMMSDKKKLLSAGLQLRKFLAKRIPLSLQPYNYYRLFRTRIKLALT
jgi:glycosyltransferase involved in cell wall biosynthesis